MSAKRSSPKMMRASIRSTEETSAIGAVTEATDVSASLWGEGLRVRPR